MITDPLMRAADRWGRVALWRGSHHVASACKLDATPEEVLERLAALKRCAGCGLAIPWGAPACPGCAPAVRPPPPLPARRAPRRDRTTCPGRSPGD